MLWNPCTGEYHVLPKPPFYPSYPRFCGFGYDSTTDDYKLLLGSYYSANEFVLVFTLKTGSWRKLEGVNSYFGVDTMGYCKKGCLVNEALHWVLAELDKSDDDVGYFASKIVSFDLAEETFHEIPFPYPPNPVNRREWSELIAAVGILDNCLTLGFQSIDALAGRSLNMWVMKDYGVKESWTEVVNIPSGVIEGGYKCISQNGEALFRLKNRHPWGLVMCNPMEKTFKILFGLDDTATYVESLVSPLMGSTNGASL
ncbi:PREDICTED: F-box protein CPR30-like [Fragaria vesca subsp. vesca]